MQPIGAKSCSMWRGLCVIVCDCVCEAPFQRVPLLCATCAVDKKVLEGLKIKNFGVVSKKKSKFAT